MTNYDVLEDFVRTRGILSVLELGTGTGFSSAKAFVRGGVNIVVTIDIYGCGKPPDERILFYEGDVQLLSGLIHQQYPEGFDAIFLDADHYYQSVKLYWELYSDLVRKFILIHDIDWCPEFLDEKTSQNYKTYILNIDNPHPPNRVAVIEKGVQ